MEEPDGGSASLWDWLDEDEPDSGELPIDPQTVTCVLVAHNGAEWLPRHLPTLAALDPRPGRIIAVDNGSDDTTAELLQQALRGNIIDVVVTGEREWSFGRAIEAALENEDDVPWLWLLHDDCAPRPDALGQLLRGAAEEQAEVIYPKLLQPTRRNYPDALAEVGQTITRTGRRVLSVEQGDIDQHQVQPAPTLGGSTAGMLISGTAWRQLDGFSPELPLHHDGVDFGWRANQAGFTVITWPEAAVMHRQASRMNERSGELLNGPHELDRLTALRLVAARGPKPSRRARLAVGSVVRAAGFLLAKSLSTAGAELRAMRRFLGSQQEVESLAARPAGDGDIEDLRPGRFWVVGHLIDRAGNGIAERYRELTASETDTSLDELTGDDFAGGNTRRTFPVSPLLALVAVLFLAGLIAVRSLIGAGAIAGGGLLPAPANLNEAWDAYLRPAVGAVGANPPWLALAAFFSTFAFANPGWFAVAGLTMGPLLAALAAYLLLRRLDVPIGLSAGAAGAWASATLTLGIITAGDVTGLALAVLAPLFVRSIHRVIHDRSTGAERLRSPAIAALWLTLMCCVWPILLPLSSLAAVIWAILRRGRRVDAVVLVAAPWLFMTPWLATLWRWPGRALTGIDPLAWPNYFPAGIAMLAGRIIRSGLPLWLNIVFFGILGLLSAYALARLNSDRTRRIIMVCIAVPMIVGTGLSRVVVSVPGGEARTHLSGWALMVVAALLAPIIVLRIQRDAQHPSKDLTTSGAVMALLSLLVASTWAWVGFQGPVQQTPSLLPSYVRDVVNSPRETRVLMVDVTDDAHLNWNLVDSRQPRWGTGERMPVGTQAAEYSALVQIFSGAQPPENLAEQLASLGISHVWTRGLDADRLAALSNAQGLTRAAADQESVIWTVDEPVSRYQLIEAEESSFVTDGVVEPSDEARYLVVAEPSDSRWQASIGDQELNIAPNRPPVSFEVPAGVAGELSVELQSTWRALIGQIVVIVILLVLSLPTLGGRVAARRGL